MAAPLFDAADGHINHLLDKLRDHTITLVECYELRTWLQTMLQDRAATSFTAKQQYLIMLIVLNALESLIYELEKAS